MSLGSSAKGKEIAKMKKRILSTALSIIMACGTLVFGSAAAAEKTPVSEITFSEPENLGKPIAATTLLNSVVSMEDGKPILCTTVSGSPALFNVVDLETGKLLHSFEAEKGNTMWTHAVDSKGNVYTAGYTRATLYRYSPETKTFEDLGAVSKESAVCQIVVDDKDNVYMATYPNAKLVKYDVATKQMMDFGNVLPGEKYFKSMVYYNGCIYGGGDAVGTQFVKIDLKTLQKTYFKAPKIDASIKSYYTATLAGDKILIYCGTQDVGSIYTVFDLKKEAFLDIMIPKAAGLSCSPELNGYSYFVANGMINKYNLKDDTYESTGIKYGSGFRGGSFAELKTHPNLPNKTFVTVVYGGSISLIDLETGVREDYRNSVEPTGTSLVAVKAIGKDVYASGHQGPRATWYDPEKREVKATFAMGQSTPIAEIDGKVYFGCYPDASLSVYDPAQPVKEGTNPKKVVRLADDKSLGQSRPMDIVGADGKVVFSTIADYDMHEGAITVYDPETGKFDCYKNIIKDQSVSGLTYKDGILYGSTTIFGGLGGDPLAQEAKIFKFDMNTRKVIKEVTPKFKEQKGLCKMAGDLAFGPDGLLWSISDGLLFAMNPETLEVVKEKSINGYNWESYSSRWNPYTLEFDKDGLLYCTPRNTAMVVDIETMEYKNILPKEYDKNCGSISVSEDGHVYFYNRDSIYRVRRTDKAEKDQMIALMIDSVKTKVGDQEVTLDVPAKTVQDRTVVPVRFIAESLGAEVKWDEATETVTIIKGSDTLKIVLGEQKIDKNGQEIKIDVTAFEENGRTLLPLRAIAEAFDKQVFWDDRGLILIGDTPVDAEKDKALIDALIEELKK